MRTLIISDLHLGGLTGIDLLRRPDVRASLLAALADVERLVILGDVLELRHGPPHEALAASRPFFEDLGRALGERELILTAGNHDHQLVSGWLQARAVRAPRPLQLEQRIAPAEASAMLARIAEWSSPARVEMAYPGVWVRPDVYATHGHYLDCHLTIPTLERLGIGAMGRLLERPEGALATVDAYEAVTSPIYAWRDAMARYARTGPALNGLATVRAWRALGGGKGPDAGRARPAADTAALGPSPPRGAGEQNGALAAKRASRDGSNERRGGGRARELRAALRSRAFRRGFPLAVSAFNRAGLGPLSPDISKNELRRAGLRGMGEVAARLGLGEAYVVFGHTHRAGPFARDVAPEWRGRAGARLINSGCWIYDAVFSAGPPGESPYWPGTCVLVEDSGPPALKRLLLDRTLAELRPLRA